MTEQNKKNREIFIDLCKTVWDFDDKSMKYIEDRTSDSWKPESDFDIFLKDKSFEDQRIRYELDMSKEEVQSFFVENDNSYKLFKNYFSHAISQLKSEYDCKIGYKEFIDNKCIFKKNVTKIKKVFEYIYSEHNNLFESDFGLDYTKETCAEKIVKLFERIGASKKSAKKLQMVISFNPIDWLMSSTSEDWSSCFNINNPSGGYQYCLGLPFQAGDKNRIMIYITDGSQKECMGIKVDHFQTRTWGILGTDDLIHIVKWYPNNTIGVKPVSAITNIDKFNNNVSFNESKYPLDILSTKKGAVINIYSDMGSWENVNGQLKIVGHEKNGQQIFSKNVFRVKQNNNTSFSLQTERLRYGALSSNYNDIAYRIPNWKKMGIHLDMFFPTLRCSICKEEKAGSRLRNGSYICYDCYNKNVYTCYKCENEYFSNVDEKHVVETTSGEMIDLCPSCFEKANERICKCCGKYSVNPLLKAADGYTICSKCLRTGKSEYAKCSVCEKIMKNVKTKYNSFEKNTYNICKNCDNESYDSFYVHFGRYFPILQKTNTKKMNGII